MQDAELQDIWKAYDAKLEESRILNLQSWVLKLQCFETTQAYKVRSKLVGLSVFKITSVIIGIVWVAFLGLLLYGNRFTNLYFSVSVSMVMLITMITIAGYIYHLYIISRIDYDGNITDTQEKLARLQSSTLLIVRIAWLQMPFYTTVFWHSSWIKLDSLVFWLVPVPITLFFALFAIYLYRNITPGNMHKKWIRALVMGGPEYASVIRSIDFINEIETFKKEMI
jgi:hypothetical protein